VLRRPPGCGSARASAPPGGNRSRPRRVKGIPPEPRREGTMTASHVRARSRQAGALLGAIAVLVAGCTAAGGGSTPRADRAGPARNSVAASPPGRVVHRIATTPRPGHGSGPGMTRASPLALCAPPLGDPVTYRAGAPSHLRVAVLACLCCHWCACAWACCGCGPGRWPPRSHLAWQCCPHPLEPPGGDSAAIPPACWPGCRSFACPANDQKGLTASSDQAPDLHLLVAGAGFEPATSGL